MSSTKCIFHPLIDTDLKCERCRNFICNECKRTQTRIYRNERTDEIENTIIQLFCPVCLYDKRIHENMGFRVFVMLMLVVTLALFVGIIFLGFFFGFIEKPRDMTFSGIIPPEMFLFLFGALFTVVPLLFIVTLPYNFLIWIPKRIKIAKRERKNFLSEFGLPENYEVKLLCNKCNTKLNIDSKICTKCGNTIFD